MKTSKQVLGKWGEDLAVQFFEEKGYSIIDRNVHTPFGELDIIAQKDGVLIFIEVKTRSSKVFSFPEDAVNHKKQIHMLASVTHYLQVHPDTPETWQFDVLAIVRQAGMAPEIEHFENIIS